MEFPGCTPYRLTREQIGDFEGRLEFWDAAAETVWVCEPTSPYHEAPIVRALARRCTSQRIGHHEKYCLEWSDATGEEGGHELRERHEIRSGVARCRRGHCGRTGIGHPASHCTPTQQCRQSKPCKLMF